MFHASENTAHVNRDGSIEVCQIGVCDRDTPRASAGIIHKTVETAEPMDRTLDHRLDIRFDCDVCADEAHRPTQRTGKVLALVMAAAGDNDGRSRSDEKLCRPSPYTAGAPGNDRNLPCQSLCHIELHACSQTNRAILAWLSSITSDVMRSVFSEDTTTSTGWIAARIAALELGVGTYRPVAHIGPIQRLPRSTKTT
jgi:hypothetical protein